MTDDDKTLQDAMLHGMGVMKDGKHVPLTDSYVDPRGDDKALVERLRAWPGRPIEDATCFVPAMMGEAADRIEALTAEVEFHKERADALALQADEWEGKYAIATAEVERLRFAMQTIGGKEALTKAGVLDAEEDAELIARITLARAALDCK